jgi:hypothetical protein
VDAKGIHRSIVQIAKGNPYFRTFLGEQIRPFVCFAS